jgi:hypothetical protein
MDSGLYNGKIEYQSVKFPVTMKISYAPGLEVVAEVRKNSDAYICGEKAGHFQDKKHLELISVPVIFCNTFRTSQFSFTISGSR